MVSQLRPTVGYCPNAERIQQFLKESSRIIAMGTEAPFLISPPFVPQVAQSYINHLKIL